MQSVNSFFQLHAESSPKQDPLSIAHTKILLKWERLKLDKPAFYDGDRFTHLYIGALGHVLMSQELPDHVIAGDAEPSPSGPQPTQDPSPQERQDLDAPPVYTFNADTVTMAALKSAAQKIVEEKLMAPIEEVAEDQAEAEGMEAEADAMDTSSYDTVFLHAISLLKHALVHAELRHSVKHGDPGRMFALFPYLITIFKATGKFMYANELIEVSTRFHTEWTEEMKLTMLCHCIVNRKGKKDTFMGIDLWQEHDVRMHKVDFPFSRDKVEGHAYHMMIGSILHILRDIKARVWVRLHVINDSKRSFVSKTADLKLLSRHLQVKKVLDWTPAQRSPVYELFNNDLVRDYANPDNRFIAQAPPAGKLRATDPFLKGTLILQGPTSNSLASNLDQRKALVHSPYYGRPGEVPRLPLPVVGTSDSAADTVPDDGRTASAVGARASG